MLVDATGKDSRGGRVTGMDGPREWGVGGSSSCGGGDGGGGVVAR